MDILFYPLPPFSFLRETSILFPIQSSDKTGKGTKKITKRCGQGSFKERFLLDATRETSTIQRQGCQKNKHPFYLLFRIFFACYESGTENRANVSGLKPILPDSVAVWTSGSGTLSSGKYLPTEKHDSSHRKIGADTAHVSKHRKGKEGAKQRDEFSG